MRFNLLSLLLLLLTYFFHLRADEKKVRRLSQEANSLFFAQQFDKAAEIYQSLLDISLLKWQKPLILYNLGTIKFTQKNFTDALYFYHLIPFEAISDPHVFKMIAWNQALCYLNLAQISDNTSELDLQEKQVNYEACLKQIKLTKKLECWLYFFENGPTPCKDAQSTVDLLKNVEMQIRINRYQQMTMWLQTTDFNLTFTVLLKGLQRLDSLAKKFFQIELPSEVQKSYFDYFVRQAESLIPLWEKIQTLPTNVTTQEILFRAINHYHLMLQDLHKTTHETVINIQQIVQEMQEIESQNKQFKCCALQLNYRLLLINKKLSIAKLQVLQELQNELSIHDKKKEDKANNYLQQSIESLIQKRKNEAQFFLLAAYNENYCTKLHENSDPQKILEKALEYAWHAKKIATLFYALPIRSSAAETIVKEMQNRVISTANYFLEKSLSFQRKLFEKNEIQSGLCLKTPWEKVYPLFSEGKQAALFAYERIDHSYEVAAWQKITIAKWKEALRLLQQPPENSSAAQAFNQTEKMQEKEQIFEEIREMQDQDNETPQSINQEQHTW